MSSESIVINHHDLQTFAAEIFVRAGMPPDDAAFCAECLVLTNLWGIDSHGVLRLPLYVRRVRSGAVNPRPAIRQTAGGLALAVLDGDDGMGYVVGRSAMGRAIELAGQFGVAAVGAVRSNHFGAAALYARMAADQGLIGIAMSNVIPNMVAPGGARPITGNNPIAIAIPTFGDFPFLLDISLSNVAGGKLLLASQKGEKIPLDWATDRQGRPTADPDEGFKGFLLPVGGHKGLGLSYVVDILSGLITDGVFQHAIKSMYKQPDEPSLTGHFFIALNPLALISREELAARMAEFVAAVHASPMWDEKQEMLLPGELEHRRAQERRANGIPLPASLVQELQALGSESGVMLVIGD